MNHISVLSLTDAKQLERKAVLGNRPIFSMLELVSQFLTTFSVRHSFMMRWELSVSLITKILGRGCTINTAMENAAVTYEKYGSNHVTRAGYTWIDIR